MQPSTGSQSPLKPEHAGSALRLAQLSFLLMILLLGWMRSPKLTIYGLESFPMDLAFLAAASLWLVALFRKEISFRFHWAYWLLLTFFVAKGLSIINSDDPQRTGFKLLTQAYLLSLPVLTFNLFRSLEDLRRVFNWWLAGTAAVAFLGVVTLLLFPVFGRNSFLGGPLHHFGTLPPGPYPRLELTFQYPAMLANYLGASLMLLMIGERLGWLGRRVAILLGGAILLSALFALSPDLGGILFILAAWFWYWNRARRPVLARAALVIGFAMPLVAVLLASVTAVHPTAPFLIQIPGLPVLAPAVRLMAWMEAVQNFLQAPLFGNGLGLDTVNVYMLTRYCNLGHSCVTDAHNTFLNVAAQTGIVGLAGLCAIVWFVARQIKAPPPQSQQDVILFGLAVAWIAGMALQGLVGSYEDTRHLWLSLGLILSVSAWRQCPRSTRSSH
jgi:putative inorganic carbon (hco3(-)) transporter